ncbi:hypothetical protein [Microcystis phage MaeS]|nr:hypothetical protein [Microcystis phage MaeS]
MTVTSISKQLEKHIKSVKVFVKDANKKYTVRPILSTALVNETYVIATDSQRLIRIKHNEHIEAPFLHYFNKHVNNLDVSSYPNIERLIPDKYNAQKELTINVSEWLEAHEAGIIAANEHVDNVIKLEGNKLSVKPLTMKAIKGNKSDYSSINKCKGYKDIAVPEFEQISFTYILDNDTELENLNYNCQYFIDALKVFKKYKHKEIQFYFYRNLRPFLLASEDIEVLILPVRISSY